MLHSELDFKLAQLTKERHSPAAALSSLHLPPQIQQLTAHIIEECQHLQDLDTLQMFLWVMDIGQNEGKKH